MSGTSPTLGTSDSAADADAHAHAAAGLGGAAAAFWRLNSTDEMLHRAAGALGSSRIIQLLWRFATPVSHAALQDEWRRLDTGRLSRVAAAAVVPGARRRWMSAANGEPVHVSSRPLTESTVPDWLDAQVRTPLPAGSGALWRLAAAPCGDGSLVSLTVPHFRSDGLGLFHAIATRYDDPQAPDAWPGADDIGDALGQSARALSESARWALRLLRDDEERARFDAALRGGASGGGVSGIESEADSAPRFFSTAILDVDAGRWRRCAEDHGGTVNSLFVEIAANLVRARVPNARHRQVDVGIPMNLRGSVNDQTANAIVVVPLTVPGGAARHDDLRGTRQATKALLQGSGAHSATLVPEPLWHLLPDALAGRLKTPGAQQTDVIASNFGRIPEAVVQFAGGSADSVALRTMNVPGLVPGKARVRASLCLVEIGDRITLTATGLPDHFGDSGSLGRIVTDELDAWGLPARHWWGTEAAP